MKHNKSRWMTGTLSVILAAGIVSSGAADKDKDQPRGQQRQGGQGNQNRNPNSPRNANPRNAEAEQQERQRQEQRRREEEQRQQKRKEMEQQKAEQERQRQEQKRKDEEQREAKRQKERAEAEQREKQREEQKRKGAEQQQDKQGRYRGNDDAKKNQDEKGRGNGQTNSPKEPSQVNQTQPNGERDGRDAKEKRPKGEPKAPLTSVEKPGGVTERLSPSGKKRESTKVDTNAGVTETKQYTSTGRLAREEVKKDGRQEIKELDLGNRETKRTVIHADNRKEITQVNYDRSGNVRARETVHQDSTGKAVSKTVVVRQNVVIRNRVVVHNHVDVVRHYRPCTWGYVYRPVVIQPVVFAAYYDPYWYGPARHHFTYSWGWHAEPWYVHHAYYWRPYPVYAAPSYWVTDWMVASYVADRYAMAKSIEESRTEVELARNEARKAREAAEEAKDAAEKAEAEAERAKLEAQLARAQERLAKAEAAEAKRKEMGDKPNPNATPIDDKTKEALNKQVAKTIDEKKEFAEKAATDTNAAPPDVAQSLKDPNHIYPVSKTASVMRAKDSEPAGTLTPGDLLKVEPGQDEALKKLDENTVLKMRVITSKGEDDSVPAGTVVLVALSDLQEFDNEFRAKIDTGLEEAGKNTDEFKKNLAKN